MIFQENMSVHSAYNLYEPFVFCYKMHIKKYTLDLKLSEM